MIKFAKELEQFQSVILTYSNSSILDAHLQFPILKSDIYCDSTLKCEFGCVTNEVEQYLFDSFFVWFDGLWHREIYYGVQV
jgi:hypothetical protein